MVDISKYKIQTKSIDGLAVFIDAAAAYGIAIKGMPITDGQVHRCPDIATPKNNKDAGWYVITQSGDIYFGAYGSWYRDSVSFCSHSTEQLSPIQRQDIAAAQQRAKELSEMQRQQAAQKAEAANESLPPADPNHPYLIAKGIAPHGALQDGDNLLYPLQVINGSTTSYQTISPTGEKRLLSKGQKKGAFYQFGDLTPTLCIAEGMATAASVHESTGMCCFAAVDRGNLAPVATALRTVYSAPFIICADNDQWTEGNPGIKDANAVASAVSNCRVAYPTFKDIATKPTDFNDLMVLEGKEAVIRQISVSPSKELKLLYANDIEAVTDTSDFVEDLLRDNEFSVVYGESNCGKTFYMMDLALHVALGMMWRGKEVEQGGVIYAALEGGHGTKNRIVAFKEHYGITGDIPLAVIPSNLNFLDADGDIKALVAAIEGAKERLGHVRLIVIDTLARAIAGGDENSSMDMGQLIINADILRGITGAHIAFIHHSGKDALKGARGHSSLRAAVDTEIEISRPDTESPSLIRVVKQREMEMIEDMSFSLKPVKLGTNKRGKDVTSCVVVPADIVKIDKPQSLTAAEQFVYDSIVAALISVGQTRSIMAGLPGINSIDYMQLHDEMDARGSKEMHKADGTSTVKSATDAARKSLKKKGKINFNNLYIWLVENC